MKLDCVMMKTNNLMKMIRPLIEDAMRRDTAAPAFGGLARCDPFRHVAFAGLCLSILWFILFDLV